ncbi:MAG: YifB family Mg chelatase-like AAA ATPase [Anaerovoracaceae bacterium]
MITIHTAVLHGIEAKPVFCEVSLDRGLPRSTIVGLVDKTVRESRERVRAAISACGLRVPSGRLTVNFSPADMQKHGSHLDLPIAVGMLAVGGMILDAGLSGYGFAGELSLDGRLNPIEGALPICAALREQGIRRVVVPAENRKEAEMIRGLEVYPARDLRQIIDHLNLKETIRPSRCEEGFELRKGEGTSGKTDPGPLDFSDVRGQEMAKRALVVAAAGGHDVYLLGNPSSGKTMMAKRVPTILPEMEEQERIECTSIYSVSGLLDRENPVVTERPFRAPNHRITVSGMIGGGGSPRPGEITLAHCGVLFLDEAGEFSGNVIDSLRRPLEEKRVFFQRKDGAYRFPADFLLIAASNPCPCGYYGSPDHECSCTPYQIRQYQSRISGPVMERIDIYLDIYPVEYEKMKEPNSMSSSEMRTLVERAREMQKKRFRGGPVRLNSEMDERMTERYVRPDPESEQFLARAYHTLKLNPRTLMKTKKLARTIADLDGREEVRQSDFEEALRYRRRSRAFHV